MAARRKPSPRAPHHDPAWEEAARFVVEAVQPTAEWARHPLVAVYACGHRIELHPRATPETDCHLCPRCGSLLGLLVLGTARTA